MADGQLFRAVFGYSIQKCTEMNSCQSAVIVQKFKQAQYIIDFWHHALSECRTADEQLCMASLIDQLEINSQVFVLLPLFWNAGRNSPPLYAANL